MTTTPTTGSSTTLGARVGQIITGLVVAFLAFDVVIHLLNVEAAREGSEALGFSTGFGPLFGVLELVGLVLYVVPRTNVLGAIWLTA